ncbi:hypothetical protein ZYGR_0A03750 [Zygosaccharomyces rouxii]|uniref:ZYRO0A08514p n=2 Tax=Zygosaccharomyces rouxii TaxID=4956 RepID=C5DQ44_ZYGRC|nr:uncharacterized protein ZYRO0A08514g [Zygosaccharomyces rouxii]KAH9198675.1 beta-lactamase-like protein [Zygosaccharomyces rouxii]GAV46780.1 hypothetical protein ZYGR_0A03750 [Zygosaccharomyces rouxii]CAR25805.1 ZYRO0A08514p [Zygosaccharomyces rouxii]
MGIKRQRTLAEFGISETRSLQIRNQQSSFGSSQDPIVVEEDEERVQEVRCPLCNADITHLEIYMKEAHAQKCLDKAPEPKKPKTRPPLPGTKIVKLFSLQIVVDGFAYDRHGDIEHYFLSHFHSDHYGGLKKSWTNGIIYASSITINLVRDKFKIDGSRLRPLPMNEKIWITDKVSVVLLDANHCPGAVVFLFEEYDNDAVVKTVLHTGDFRANNKLIEEVKRWTTRLDEVYLDTTYLIPGFHFPSQESVLEVTSNFAKDLVNRGFQSIFQNDQKSIVNYTHQSPKLYKLLFLVGTYTIGKEKLAISLAQVLGTKIFIPAGTPRHRMISQYMEYFPSGLITHDVKESCVHLVPLRILNSKDSIQSYFQNYSSIYEDVVGFIPTGWTFTSKWAKKPEFSTILSRMDYCKEVLHNTQDALDINFVLKQFKKYQRFQVFKVPYSEHSSFKDLVNFGCSMDYKTILATVNLHNIKEMNEWFATWQNMRNDSTFC